MNSYLRLTLARVPETVQAAMLLSSGLFDGSIRSLNCNMADNSDKIVCFQLDKCFQLLAQ